MSDGKGFAVVAGEVRSLAEQSRVATSQVKEILGEIQKATNTAVMVTEEGSKRTEAGQQLARSTGETIEAIEGDCFSIQTRVKTTPQLKMFSLDAIMSCVSQCINGVWKKPFAKNKFLFPNGKDVNPW